MGQIHTRVPPPHLCNTPQFTYFGFTWISIWWWAEQVSGSMLKCFTSNCLSTYERPDVALMGSLPTHELWFRVPYSTDGQKVPDLYFRRLNLQMQIPFHWPCGLCPRTLRRLWARIEIGEALIDTGKTYQRLHFCDIYQHCNGILL